MAPPSKSNVVLLKGGNTPKRCWLWHRWGRWEDKTEFTVTRGLGTTDNPKRAVGEGLVQERRCLRCNLAILRTTKTETV